MSNVFLANFEEGVFKTLWQDLEEKIHHVEFCLSHGSDLIREIDTLTVHIEMNEDEVIELDTKISEAKAFIFTGRDDIGELKDIYQELKYGRYRYQDQDRTLWPLRDRSSDVGIKYSNSEQWLLTEERPLFPDIKDLIRMFEEKMLQAPVCFFHAKKRVQAMIDLIQEEGILEEKMVATRAFVNACHQVMQQLNEQYQELKESAN